MGPGRSIPESVCARKEKRKEGKSSISFEERKKVLSRSEYAFIRGMKEKGEVILLLA